MIDYSLQEIRTWDQFRDIAQQYKSDKKKRWIFRGHKPGEKLESSLERAVKHYPPEWNDNSKTEKLLLREFKRRYHQYSANVPKEKDCLEWFSIMQHYGAPTRLIDFTYSIYVAVYFALEHAGKDHFEVFAVNATWAVKRSGEVNNCKEKNNFFDKLIDNTCKDRKEFEQYFIENSPKKFVCPINPFRLDERISLQNGVFMCPGNVSCTFEENLENLINSDKECNKNGNIVQFILKFATPEIIKARECLYDLNITGATLFPGLEGFAKSLTTYPPKFLVGDNSHS